MQIVWHLEDIIWKLNSPLDLYRRMAKRAFIGRCSKCNHKTNLFDIEYSNWSFLSYVQPKTVTKFNKTARKILQLLIWTKINIPVSPFIQSFWQKRLFLFSHSKRVLQRRQMLFHVSGNLESWIANCYCWEPKDFQPFENTKT